MSRGRESVLFAVSEAIQSKLDYVKLEESLAIQCIHREPSNDAVVALQADECQSFTVAVLSVTGDTLDQLIDRIKDTPKENLKFDRYILVSETPILSDMSKGWDSGMLGYVPLSCGISGLNQLLELYLSPQKEIAQLSSQLKEASELAVVAMSASSQLGEIIRFLELANLCATAADLGQLMLTTMDKMGLQGSLILRTDEGDIYCGPSDKESYQTRLIESFVGGERFIDIDVSTVVNFNTISGLVKNMPGPDSEEQGRVKDTLFRLFEGSEERLKQIQVEQKIHKAERVRHQFLAILAHELKTPMNATLGFFRRLARITPGEVVTERHISAVQTVEEANQRLANVIENIVDLASVGSVDDIKKSKVLVWDVCFGIVSDAKQQAENKGLGFTSDIDETLHAELEPGRMKRILKVLIDNAIKYTEAGLITLSVQIDVAKNGVEQLVFTVTDTGRGIAAEKTESIFEPFAIGDDYLTRTHEGAGLGMAIAAEYTRELGGEIALQSMLSEGTKIMVRVPRFEVKPPSDDIAATDVELF